MHKHLFIAVPSYSPQIFWQTSDAIHRAAKSLNAMGWKTSVTYAVGCADLGRARNALVATFHGEPDFTDMLFIDGDVSWSEGTVERLMSHPVDFVFGAYPIKGDGKGFPVSGFDDQKTEVKCVNPITGEEVDGGLCSVRGAPAGFMRITKECARRMIEAYDHLWYGDEWCPQEKAWGLFEFSVHDHKRMGEDMEFCRKWIAIGGKVWLDPWLTLKHHGYNTWTGCLVNYWRDVKERAREAQAGILQAAE